MAQLRISDLPQVTEVNLNDYLMINSGNVVTSIISADSYTKQIIQIIIDDGLIPDVNVDGGNVVPPIFTIIDGGTPTADGAPLATVLNGGTPVSAGYGPSADGGTIS